MEVLSSQPLLTRVRQMLLYCATGNKALLTQVCVTLNPWASSWEQMCPRKAWFNP